MGIYKRKKIIRAYSRFPRLRIRDLMFGDIINWTPGRTVWRPAAKWMESAAQRGIIAFQRWKYPNSPRIYSTHSIIHLMEGVCWNVTAPRADYLKLQEGKLNRNKVYIVCRYRDFRVKTAADRQIIYNGIELLDESAYDAPQLLAILIQEYLGFPKGIIFTSWIREERPSAVRRSGGFGLSSGWRKAGRKAAFGAPGGNYTLRGHRRP
jgi:hypothetical protein